MVRGVRPGELFWLAGFMAISALASACALISGLDPYAAVVGGDASAPGAHGGSPGTSSTSSGQPLEGPDAMPEPDVSVTTGEMIEGGADAYVETPATDGATDAHVAAMEDDGRDTGPTADADDGSKPHDSGEAGNNDGGCTPVTHSNGIDGGTPYVDCAPLDTHSDTEAAKACASANVGSCAKNTLLCVGLGDVECTQNASTCHCWSYSGRATGHVSTGLGVVCACPGAADPQWH